jgi:hypothetical protein
MPSAILQATLQQLRFVSRKRSKSLAKIVSLCSAYFSILRATLSAEGSECKKLHNFSALIKVANLDERLR